jgi:hypothetical protein
LAYNLCAFLKKMGLQCTVLLDQSPEDVKVYGDFLHALSAVFNRRILNERWPNLLVGTRKYDSDVH